MSSRETDRDLLAIHTAVDEDAERYRALFDTAAVALLVTDRDLTVVEANNAAAHLLRVDAPLLAGTPFSSYVAPASRRTLQESALALESGASSSALLRMRRGTGGTFEAFVTAAPGDAEVYWSLVEREKPAPAEARVREPNRDHVAEQAAALQALVAQLRIGVVVLRADGEVSWSNERARTIFDGDPVAASRLAEAAPGRVPLERADGTTIVLRVVAAPLESQMGGTVVAVEDVTARHRLERADEEFVENAAHQLHNPITAIASSVAALLAGAAEDEAERDRFLSHIARETDRMGRLVDGLLSLAGLQRGGARPIVELLPLRALVDDVVATLLDADCTVRVDVGDEIAVVGDRELFAQAIGNVLANACEYATHEVTVHGTLAGATVELDIADDGPGIAPAERERVFDRFVRSRSAGRKGSGLGLAIARAAAHATRSSIEVVQTDGPGATFRFRMPGARLL